MFLKLVSGSLLLRIGGLLVPGFMLCWSVQAEMNQPLRVSLELTDSAKGAGHSHAALTAAVEVWRLSLVQGRALAKPIKISVDYFKFENDPKAPGRDYSNTLATAASAGLEWPEAYVQRNRQAGKLPTSFAADTLYSITLLASRVPEVSDALLTEVPKIQKNATAKGKAHGWVSINANLMNASGNGYFGTDGKPGISQWDATSVFVHELGHAWGFNGWLPRHDGQIVRQIVAFSAFDVEVGIWTGNGAEEPTHWIGGHSGNYVPPVFLAWAGRRGWGIGAYRARNLSAGFPMLHGDPGGSSYIHHFADAPNMRDDTMIWRAANGRTQLSTLVSSCCLAEMGWHIVPMLIQFSRFGGVFFSDPEASGESKSWEENIVNGLTIMATMPGLARPAARIMGSAAAYAHIEWGQEPPDTVPQFWPYELRVVVTETPSVGVHRIPILFQYGAEGVAYNVIRTFELYVPGEDTDGDGISDAHEVCPPEFSDCAEWPFDPNVMDGNGNGVEDGYDDWDGDNLSNGLEFLSGTDPFTQNWDDVPAATDDASQEIVIRNQGAWPVELSDAYIDGADADQFLLEGLPAFSTIEPGRSVALRVYHVGMDNAVHDDAWVQIEYTSANRARSKAVTLVGDDTAKRIDF